MNMMRAINKIAIKCPDGTVMWSTHTCNLAITWLPMELTEAYIFPDLAHASLVSIQKFCKAVCQVVFSEEECRVYYNIKLVVVGGRDTRGSKLWQLPINPTHKPGGYERTIEHLDLQIPPIS